MCRSASDLKEIYPKLVSHSMQYFGAKEVMNFLGKQLVGQCQSEVVSDMTDRCKRRLPGTRVKHRAKMNWIKMVDKAGSVLRVETVINPPDAFTVRQRVRRGKRQVTQWVPMRKGVANLLRYREASLAANKRYLEALAVVDDQSTALKHINHPSASSGYCGYAGPSFRRRKRRGIRPREIERSRALFRFKLEPRDRSRN